MIPSFPVPAICFPLLALGSNSSTTTHLKVLHHSLSEPYNQPTSLQLVPLKINPR